MHALVLTLLACGLPEAGAPEAWEPGAEGAPPAPMTLTVPDLVPGEVARLEAFGAAPGSTVHLVMGSPGDGPCPAILDGGCLGVTGLTRLMSSVADDGGLAAFDMDVPESVRVGFEPTFQAVSTEPALSEVSTTRVVAAGAVSDFSLVDLNDTSPRFDEPVSPRDYLTKVSGWYFGHAS